MARRFVGRSLTGGADCKRAEVYRQWVIWQGGDQSCTSATSSFTNQGKEIMQRNPNRLLSIMVAALTSTAISCAVMAQPANQPGQEQMPAQQRAEQVQSELIEIQRNTLEENPELREQAEELENLITETMKEHGANPEEDLQRLQELQQQAQNPDVDQAQREQMAREFQEIQRELIMARQQAAQDQEVQTEQEQFQTAMLEAMQEQNPRTEELLAEMREIQVQQQRQLQEQIQQQQGQPQAAPQPERR
jgi:hypothetical protein